MMQPIQQLVLSLLCASVAGYAIAAQPGAAPAPLQRASGVSTAAPLLASSAPGTLKAFKAMATEVEAGKSLTFKLEGTGHCKVKVSGGDGSSTDFEGNLDFSAAYVYGTGSMSSFEAFNDYNASVVPLGNCKTTGSLAAIKVRVINPAPQGVPAAGSQAPAMSSTNPGLTMIKPKP